MNIHNRNPMTRGHSLTLLLLAAFTLASCTRAPEARQNQTQVDSSSGNLESPSPSPLPATAATGPSTALVTTPWVDTKQVMDTSINAPNLQCAPKIISRGDTLTLRMEVPHGEYLAVSRPDRAIFFLVYPKPEPNDFLVLSEPFKDMPIIRFRADLQARPRIYGRETPEPLFSGPGDYLFVVGDHLESEGGEEYAWKCSVRFQP